MSQRGSGSKSSPYYKNKEGNLKYKKPIHWYHQKLTQGHISKKGIP